MSRAAGVSRRRKKMAKGIRIRSQSYLKKKRQRMLKKDTVAVGVGLVFAVVCLVDYHVAYHVSSKHSPILKKAWNDKRTVDQNLTSLGFVSSIKSNETFKGNKRHYNDNDDSMQVDQEDTTIAFMKKKNVKKLNKTTSPVVQELEDKLLEKKTKKTSTQKGLSKDLTSFAQFCVSKYGPVDYKSMSRDPKNRFQFSVKKIKSVIRLFLKNQEGKACGIKDADEAKEEEDDDDDQDMNE